MAELQKSSFLYFICSEPKACLKFRFKIGTEVSSSQWLRLGPSPEIHWSSIMVFLYLGNCIFYSVSLRCSPCSNCSCTEWAGGLASVSKNFCCSHWQGSQLNIDYRHSRGTVSISGDPHSHMCFWVTGCT